MKEKTREPKTGELVAHLDRNMDNPIVIDAITGKVPFSVAVNGFYGASSIRDTEVEFRDDGKAYNEIPRQLINILSPFDSQRELDIEKLQYGAVREDNPKFNRTTGWTLLSLVSAVGAAASVVCIGFRGLSTSGVPEGLIASVASSIGFSASFCYASYRRAKEFIGSNPFFSEYTKLRNLGGKADKFLSGKYRMELIRRQFSDGSEKE